jgi:uncharacterized DUF497 family protein
LFPTGAINTANLAFSTFNRGRYLSQVPQIMVWFMVFNATFNNISVISWRSVLLVDETGLPGKNH